MKARVLIVEDERIVQLDLLMRLQGLGHTVVALASRGEEAVTKAAELAPDVVLMDVRLEGPMDGIEAAQRIRTIRRIPIVYVTGNVPSSEADEGHILGPCLSKPFRTAELQDAIERAIRGPEPR